MFFIDQLSCLKYVEVEQMKSQFPLAISPRQKSPLTFTGSRGFEKWKRPIYSKELDLLSNFFGRYFNSAVVLKWNGLHLFEAHYVYTASVFKLIYFFLLSQLYSGTEKFSSVLLSSTTCFQSNWAKLYHFISIDNYRLIFGQLYSTIKQRDPQTFAPYVTLSKELVLFFPQDIFCKIQVIPDSMTLHHFWINIFHPLYPDSYYDHLIE